MLSLRESLRIGGFTVFRDSRSAQRFYALADAPRVARDAGGLPEIDLVWYRLPPGADASPAAGGLLTLTVQSAPTAQERESLARGIREALGVQDPELLAVPFSHGVAELAVAGEAGAAGDFLNSPAVGPAPLAGTSGSTFVAELTREGAAVVAEALEHGRDVLMLRLDLTVQHRLEDVAMRVWCDSRRVAELRHASGAELARMAIARDAAGFSLMPERPLSPEETAALERLGRGLLQSAVERALDGAAGMVEMTLRSSTAVDLPLSQSGVIELGATAAQLGERIRRIDVDPARGVMEVKVVCTASFEEADPIAAVRAVLRYAGDGPGGRVERTSEFVFGPGQRGPLTFRTDLAAPDARDVSCDVEVFYRGEPEPERLSLPPAPRPVIVLDLEDLGVQRVRVNLRDVPWEDVAGATVRLEHPAGPSATLVLDRDNPSGEWVAVTRRAPEGYAATVTWRLADGTATPPADLQSTERVLELDAPAALRRGGTVELISTGDFGGISHALVELQAEGVDGAPIDSQTFTGAGQTFTWQPPLGAPRPLRYRWRQTLVHADGGRTETEWASSDAPVLAVGDTNRFTVTVVSRLLGLTGSVRLALVDLEHVDERGEVRERATLTIDDGRDQQWSFHMAPAGSHTYRYRLTLVKDGGVRDELPWQQSDSAILVLRPAGI